MGKSREGKQSPCQEDFDRVDDDIGAEAAGQFAHGRHGVSVSEVGGVSRPHRLCGLELSAVDVHRDDLCRAGEPGSGDRVVPDAAAADDSG
ncbi:hypothetical protein M271_50270 [Streptomyces rapamycinicus NRRL 5491]|uniref:Uncharacterized protein n=1 Tax=Streptomyces rapamycinicus (strain ATCC 29253 / DSM 41530 / NRRL 5491 / AYB-994) TaxID=1343740 RepID=A0A0A0NPC8_STRRN|nr:hypothetical protein M271_50270 [Streptomyces rapamycinicus NRRL 5491]RLV71750.1 hypothetical protein D3C57_144525 [Streptomyces rapamycinicus NRRL 5491]